MSRVQFPPPAPTVSSNPGCRFCNRFCKLCSLFGLVELIDDRLGRRRPVNVTPDDLGNVLLFPSHDASNHTLWQSRDVETRCRGAAQVVKVQITFGEASVNLCLVEGTAKPVLSPRTAPAAGQDRGRALRDACQQAFERVVERDDCFSAMSALACGNDDRVLAYVRPGQAQQIAEAQAGVRR